MEAAWVDLRACEVCRRYLWEVHSNEDLSWRLLLELVPHCCVCGCCCGCVLQVLCCVCDCEVLQDTVRQDAFMHLQVMAGVCSFRLLVLLYQFQHWVPFRSQFVLWGVGGLQSTTASAVLLSISKLQQRSPPDRLERARLIQK
jgi:hypothetical protein